MKVWVDCVWVWVWALVFNDEWKVLVNQRWPDANNERGLWEFPGWTVELWDSLEKTVVLEVEQETGVRVEVQKFLWTFDHILENENQHWVNHAFLATHTSWEIQIPEWEKNKILSCMWMPFSDAINLELTRASQDTLSAYYEVFPQARERDLLSHLEDIQWSNKQACLKLYEDHIGKIQTSKWAQFKHQAWEWWYVDHLESIMKYADRLYPMMVEVDDAELPFTLWDAKLVLFLHDLEKPWKYAGTSEEKQEFSSHDDYQDFINAQIEKYEIALSDNQKNALKYIHGEWDDHNPREVVQWPLAAFVHMCDTWSARIRPDFPKEWNRSTDRRDI